MTDEEYQDMMQFNILENIGLFKKALFYTKFFNRKWSEKPQPLILRNTQKNFSSIPKLPISTFLTFEDKELLIEYAPKLFNTYNNKNYSLEDAMFLLAYKLYHYRRSQESATSKNMTTIIEKTLGGKYKKTYKSQSKTERIESFKKHIQTLHYLMGGYYGSNGINCNLKQELEKAFNNPEEYIYQPIRYKPLNKKILSDTLKILEIKGKTKVIKEFLSKIKQS